MFEFFKDPFGTKRIAELRGEKTATLFKMQQLVGQERELHKKIAAKDAEIAAKNAEIADLLAYEEEYNLLICAALTEEPRTRSAGSAALMLCLRYEKQLPKAMAASFKGVKSAMRWPATQK